MGGSHADVTARVSRSGSAGASRHCPRSADGPRPQQPRPTGGSSKNPNPHSAFPPLRAGTARAPIGAGATPGARVWDPAETPEVGTAVAREWILPFVGCCGSQTRAPLNCRRRPLVYRWLPGGAVPEPRRDAPGPGSLHGLDVVRATGRLSRRRLNGVNGRQATLVSRRRLCSIPCSCVSMGHLYDTGVGGHRAELSVAQTRLLIQVGVARGSAGLQPA